MIQCYFISLYMIFVIQFFPISSRFHLMFSLKINIEQIICDTRRYFLSIELRKFEMHYQNTDMSASNIKTSLSRFRCLFFSCIAF